MGDKEGAISPEHAETIAKVLRTADGGRMTSNFHDLMLTEEAARNPKWAEVREARLKERKYPYNPIQPATLYERLRRLPHAIKDWYWHKPSHRLKWKRERMRKGWSEYDWWSIDRHFAQMIAEVARKYRDEGHGYPIQQSENGEELAEVLAIKKWNTILTEMADGFENYAKEKLEWDDPQVKHAMALFAEWFPAMWD